MRVISAVFALALVAGCSSADSNFESSCMSMTKKTDDMEKDEAKAFCGCLTEQTSEMDKKPRKEFAQLMKSYKKDDQFDEQLEKAMEKGKISQAEGQAMFSAMKGCALNGAM